MKLNIDTEALERSLVENIKKEYEKRFVEIARSQLDVYFADKSQYYYGHKDGEGTAFIRNIIETRILELDSSEKLTAIINKHWDRILEEACVKAMSHKANKMAFGKVKDIPSED